MRKRVWIERMRCNVNFEIPSFQERRLAGTCFRGRDLRKAGNLCRWEHADEMFDDEQFRKYLVEEIVRRTHGVKFSPSVTIPLTFGYGEYVGWASTRPIRQTDAVRRERFYPNPKTKRATALRVCRGEPILAKATNLVTLVVEFRKNRDGITATIHTIYPGPYVGELRATEPGEREPVDVTEREGVVFFDWNHDGEPLAGL